MSKEVKRLTTIHLTDVKSGDYCSIDGKLYTVIKRNKYKYSIIPINIKEAKHYNIEASDYEDLNIEFVYDGKSGDRIIEKVKEDKNATN